MEFLMAHHLNWIGIGLLLLAAASAPGPALAGQGGLLDRPGAGPEALLPRIQCPDGYTARVYAGGLSSPDGLAFSPGGILYVAEETAGRVSRVEADGSVTRVVFGLDSPEGIAFDAGGNLYVVEDVAVGRLIQVTPAGRLNILADGLAAPEGVAVGADGTLYVTESTLQSAGNPFDVRTRVSAVSPDGQVTPLRTDPFSWSYAGIIAAPDGGLYVTNEGSGTLNQDSVFVVDPDTGARSLFARNLASPEGLRFAAAGGFPLYVAQENTGDGAGVLSRVEANGAHIPLCTGFESIEDVAMDGEGRVYVSEDGTGQVILIEPARAAQPPAGAAILFIGDGMGEAQRTAARWSAAGRSDALAMDRMPALGWAHTAPANYHTTDSAAAATALATGVKTNNRMIGQDPDGNPLTTILERAQARGMAVGLVTTVEMAEATPGAFAAHVPDRAMRSEIARQMLEHRVDVLLGGGEWDFLPDGVSGCYGQGTRSDGRNLVQEAEAAGYTHVCTASELAAVAPTETTRLLGLFGGLGLARPPSPSLAAMTAKALDILSQDPDGFFLMVEGGQIDLAGHSNNAAAAITDTLGLDSALSIARAYAAGAGDTLVIVTADHETGGMSASLESGAQGPFHMPDGTPFYVSWSTQLHTAADVPTTAQGPWSHLLAGSYENTHIHDVMRMALESAPELALVQSAQPPHNTAVFPGQTLTYTLTLTNSGGADATGVVITDSLDPGVSLVDVTPAGGVHGPDPLVVDVGSMAGGAARSYRVRVSVADLAGYVFIYNTAALASDQTPPQASNAILHRVYGLGFEPRYVHLPLVLK
jgi:alkaline phosphatase